jgi:CheY-like chemotaxis protein
MGFLDFIKKKPESQAPATATQPQYKVLVVDDELYLREFYQDLLTRQGYSVIMATNGQEALDMVTKEQPHLILLDIKMPVMDGNEVLKRLWENDLTKKIPVIVLTNAGDMTNMDKAKFYSSYQFFIKSNVSPEEVIKTVNEALHVYSNTAV